MSHKTGIIQILKSGKGCFHCIDRILGAQGLAEHVIDTGGIAYRAYSSTGDNTGTRYGRTQEHAGALELAEGLMRHSHSLAGNGDHVCLSLVDRFTNSFGDIISLTKAITDTTTLVSNDDQCGE